MRPDAVRSYLVILANIVGMKGLILLVHISLSYPSRLLTITWVLLQRLSSFRNFLVDFPSHLNPIELGAFNREAKCGRLAFRNH